MISLAEFAVVADAEITCLPAAPHEACLLYVGLALGADLLRIRLVELMLVELVRVDGADDVGAKLMTGWARLLKVLGGLCMAGSLA